VNDIGVIYLYSCRRITILLLHVKAKSLSYSSKIWLDRFKVLFNTTLFGD
jgi:hypothetical protein